MTRRTKPSNDAEPRGGRTELKVQRPPVAETQIADSSTELPSAAAPMPALTVLAHPDVARVGDRVLLPELAAATGEVALGRTEPAFAQPGSRLTRPLDDVHLSRQPIHLIASAINGSLSIHRSGSPTPVKVDGERLASVKVFDYGDLRQGCVLVLGRRVTLLLHLDSPSGADDDGPRQGMIGESIEIRQLRRQARVAARLEVPIHLRGESGTGKELVALAIHQASRRRSNAFVAINMAAVPESIASAELFGAAKGAFTGADQRKDGYFQRAAHGTLFLDEIGETPEAVQPLLLRALESGDIQPVGAVAARSVDVRLISATDADLEAKIEHGSFRAPLLHRLVGYEIRLPPLRERRSDLGRLLIHFLHLELTALDAVALLGQPDPQGRPWPTAGLVAQLALCRWPGNVRQLRNIARQLAIARVTSAELQLDFERLGELKRPRGDSSYAALLDTPAVEEFPAAPRTDDTPSEAPHGWRPAYRKPSDVTDAELLEVLELHRFELKASAEALGISRASLYGLVQDHPQVPKVSSLATERIEAAVEAAGGDLDIAAHSLRVSRHALKRRLRSLSSND